MQTRTSRVVLIGALGAALALPATAVSADARSGGGPRHGGGGTGPVTPATPKVAEATGRGGAVATVDEVATQVGTDVLRRGGNAADAAVATAATLGVTEPYSSGIGGGGFLVYYDARTKRISTVDGRENAPRSFTPTVFTDGAGTALDFTTVVNSGLSVGVPGTPALWATTLRRWGTTSWSQALAPAQQVASRGFVVDQTFHDQTAQNAARFARFPETARVFLRGGQAPAVGSVFTNPDLARTYAQLRRTGVQDLYRGDLARRIVAAAQHPATAPGVSVYPGQVTTRDLAAYRAKVLRPTHTVYRGLDVYGMPVPSSGGIAVGEALNLLEAYDRQTRQPLWSVDDTEYLHRFAEATATAFADRNRWVGDVPGVPARQLLSQGFADERACTLFDPEHAHARPIPFGSPDGSYACRGAAGSTAVARDDHGTTHLTVADRWGDVAAYTLTIEQTGGSAITVPGKGFLLNNELTDFDFVPLTPGVPDPNLPAGGKQPRSSISPTIITDGRRPVLAVGSPGGATIITTVAQVITEYLDRGKPLVAAIAAPRVSSRNAPGTEAEPAVFAGPLGDGLRALGHTLVANPEIGAATGIRLLGRDRFDAAAETVRRGGGSAQVVRPDRR